MSISPTSWKTKQSKTNNAMDVNKKLSSLQELSKCQLSKILTLNSHKKHLVLESNLIRPLERVCGIKWLKGNGVEKIFKLEERIANFGAITQVYYMIFANLDTFHQVTNQIRSTLNEGNPKIQFHLIVVPRYLYIFEEELERLGLLFHVVQLHSFIWLPLYLDVGVLSLEIPHVYSSIYLKGDMVFLPVLSNTLWQLLFVVGKPKLILALGRNSNILLDQLEMLCEGKGESDKLDSDFGSVIMVDRNIDYTSALLTPSIYSGLLHEVYKVNSGICDLKEKQVDDTASSPQETSITFSLDSGQDSVYADIKNRYFIDVIAVISNLTKQLKVEKNNSKDMSLDEMKRYVQTQLQETKKRKKCIMNHLTAAETIIKVLGNLYENQKEVEKDIMKDRNKSVNLTFLEEILYTEKDKQNSLRLFCLLCITQQLSENEIKSYWRKFIHQFGWKYQYAYKNLTNANFIYPPTTGSTSLSKIKLPKFTQNNFYSNVNKLKQIPPNFEKINLKFPTCASYVYGGCYIPLIVQIASMLINSTPLEQIKVKLDELGVLTIKNDRGFPLQNRSVLIYVIGGVTPAEIAACNLLEILTGSRIVILSDRIISGKYLMQEILET